MPDPADHLPLTPLSHALLLALADGPLHGYAVMKAVATQSGGRVGAGTGTLYAALQRMEDGGLIRETAAGAGEEEDGRRRYYEMTELGRAVARAEASRLASVLALAERKRLGPEGTS